MVKVVETTSAQSVISTKLLEAISVLSENLIQSEPFLRFQQADRKLQTDQVAIRLLSDFAELQQKVRTQQRAGIINESDLNQLGDLQVKIGSNEVLQEYEMAQQYAIAFLREVNQEISQLLGIDFASLTRRPGGCC